MYNTRYIQGVQVWIMVTNGIIILSSIYALVVTRNIDAVEQNRGKKKLLKILRYRGYLTQIVIILFTVLLFFLGSMLDKAEDARSRRQEQEAAKVITKLQLALESERKASTKLRLDLEATKAENHAEQSKLAIKQARTESKLAKAKKDSAEAQIILEKTLEEVRKRQMPRTLSNRQRVRLIQLLKETTGGEVDVQCVNGDGEAYAFATEINALLRTGGWPVTSDVGKWIILPSPSSLSIVVDNAHSVPQYAVCLQQIFKRVGLPLIGLEDANLAQGKVVILVGNRDQLNKEN